MEKPPYINLHDKLPQEENQRLFEEIERGYLSKAKSQKHPQCIFLGGPPASGKSTIAASFIDNDYILINIDKLRQYHPSFKTLNIINDKYTATYTNPDAGIWYEKLIRASAEKRCHVLIENTFKDKETCLYLCEGFVQSGYQVHIKAMAVPYDKLLLGTYSRYEIKKAEKGFGRFSMPYSLDDAYRNFPNVVENIKIQGLVKSIELYSRQEMLFNSIYANAPLKDIIQTERVRVNRPQEISEMLDSWNVVRQLMKKRWANIKEFHDVISRLEFCTQLMKEENYPEENIHIIIGILQQFRNDLIFDHE
jgi:UDP-N-acetylglucosamine kinase